MGIVDEAIGVGGNKYTGNIVDEAAKGTTTPFWVKAANFLTGHFPYEEDKPEIEKTASGYKVNVPESAEVPLLQSPEMALAGGAVVGTKAAGSLLQKLLRGSQEAASWASGGVTDAPKIVKEGVGLAAKPFVKTVEAKNLAPRMTKLREKGLDVPIDVEGIPVSQDLLQTGTKPAAKMQPAPETKTSIVDEVLGPIKEEAQIKQSKDQTFIGWIKDRGGLWDESLTGETRGLGTKEEGVVGLVNKKTGQAIDELTDSAIIDGWLPEGSSTVDFLGLLNKDIRAIKGGKPELRAMPYTSDKFDQFAKRSMKAGDKAISDEVTARQKQGYIPVKEKMPVGDIEQGDKILIQGEEFTHTGFDKNGNAIIKDGQTYELDPFDQLPVDGIKRVTPIEKSIIESGGRGLTQDSLKTAMLKVEPEAGRGAIVSARELRKQFPDIPKEEFDLAIMDMAKTGDIHVSEHSSPKLLSDAERENLINGGWSRKEDFGGGVVREEPVFYNAISIPAKRTGEEGFISPALLGRTAGGLTGAAIGYKEDTEHPIRGVLFGGATGALGVKAGEVLFKNLKEKTFWESFRRFWKPESTLPKDYYPDPKQAAEGLETIAMKEASPEAYLDLRGTTKGWIQRVDNLVSRITKNLEKYDPETRAMMSDWMRGKIDIADLPKDAQITAKNMRTMQTLTGQMLVKRGRLKPETFEANKGEYLHNVFAKYMGEGPLSGNAGISNKLQENYLKQRMDSELWKSLSEFGPEAKGAVKDFIDDKITIDQVPEEVQKIAGKLKEIDEYRKSIGQVKDVAVEFPLSVGQPLKDVGIHDMFKEIKDNPFFTWTPKPIKVGKETFDITSLGTEIEAMEKVAKSMPDIPQVQERLAALKEGHTKALENKEAFADIPQNFKRIPEGKSYGPLAGKVVRREIVDDIVPIFSGFKGDKNISKILDTAYDIETKSMAIFKGAKTTFNAPTAVRNFFSNPSQLLMSGVSAHELPVIAKEAITHIKNKDQLYGQALRNGLFKSNFGTEEISKILKTFDDVPEGAFYKFISKIGDVGQLYGKIDDFWKMVKFTEQVKKGADFKTATREAQKWVMDYSLAHPAVKEARKHLMPFVSYTYKIIPLIQESMAKRPWVIPSLFAIPYAVHQTSKAALNLTEEDFTKLKRQLPEFIRKSGSYVLVPWKSPEGNAQWVNLDYFFPWGNFKQMESLFRNKEYGEAFGQIGISNPLIDIYTVMKGIGGGTPPKDPFTQIPVYNNLDNPTEKTVALAEWLYNKYAPPMITRFGALGTMEKAITGEEDKYGRTATIPQAALRFGGLNIVAPSLKQAQAEKKYLISQAKTDFISILKNAKTPEKKKEALEAFRERIKEINE